MPSASRARAFSPGAAPSQTSAAGFSRVFDGSSCGMAVRSIG